MDFFRLGLATAPVLFAAESHPDVLEPMIKRRFNQDGDVEKAFEIVINSQGLEKTKELANEYSQAAIDSIEPWCESPAKNELKQLISVVIERMSWFSTYILLLQKYAMFFFKFLQF